MEMYTLDTAMIRLKEIAESLENGDYDLEMSMKLYEEGVRIITFCNKALSNAKQKVTELSEYSSLEEDEDDEQQEV
ncbi:MAG: exodeoxyribonuclease VII small subunit [Acutalibacteraceae bacterium]